MTLHYTMVATVHVHPETHCGALRPDRVTPGLSSSLLATGQDRRSPTAAWGSTKVRQGTSAAND